MQDAPLFFYAAANSDNHICLVWGICRQQIFSKRKNEEVFFNFGGHYAGHLHHGGACLMWER